MRIVALLIAGLLISVCAACSGIDSSSMRIEVEVYKGPLSLEPEMQWAELLGYLEEARATMIQTRNGVVGVVAAQDFDQVGKGLCKSISSSVSTCEANTSSGSMVTGSAGQQARPIYCETDAGQLGQECKQDFAGMLPYSYAAAGQQDASKWCEHTDGADFWKCLDLQALYEETTQLIEETNSFLNRAHNRMEKDTLEQKEIETLLKEVMELATEYHAKSFRWAIASTPAQSGDWKVRTAIVTFIVASAEYGNQLRTRVDALMKQLSPHGHDRRELTPSVYLREVKETDFVNLYNWYGASDPLSRMGAIGSVEDRIKIVERLFTDHHWSKINTVYASGRGKVQMALVKDEVGNWNLKSFDNDPSELVDAYVQVGKNLLMRAADLAKNVAAPGAPAASQILIEQLLSIAGRATSTAGVVPKIQNTDVNQVTAALEEQLRAKTVEIVKIDKNLMERYGKQAANATDAAQLRSAVLKHRRNSLRELELLLNEHSKLLDALSR